LYRVWAGAAPHWLIGAVLALLVNSGSATDLETFATDGCSDFPNGTFDQTSLWLNCCIAHDVAYWLGGTAAQRTAADNQLQVCVADIGQPEIAAIMLAGVRVGGSPYWPTRYRWGYGWPYWDGFLPRGYRSLSDVDKQLAKSMLPEELMIYLLP
jgi:hypothetical protein